jgi:hypothetical protein
VRSSRWISIEKIRNCQFDSVVGLTINGSGEESREGGDGHVGDIIILAKRVKKGILEFR